MLFRLKDNVKFHLFISTTPCGDGRIFAPHENHDGIDNHPNRKIRGLLRAKLESGEGTIPVANDNVKLQTWDAILHVSYHSVNVKSLVVSGGCAIITWFLLFIVRSDSINMMLGSRFSSF